MAENGDILEIEICQSLPTRRWRNTRYFSVVDNQGFPERMQEALADLVDTFWLTARFACADDWVVGMCKLTNVTRIAEPIAKRYFGLNGQQFIPKRGSDPRLAIRYEIFGNEDVELPLVRNTLFLSGITPEFHIDGRHHRYDLVEPLSFWLSTDQFLPLAEWNVRPMVIQFSESGPREAVFHRARYAQASPLIRQYQRRRIRGIRGPSYIPVSP